MSLPRKLTVCLEYTSERHHYSYRQHPFSLLATLPGLSTGLDWIGLSSVLRPRQHSIGYMGDGFYRSKDQTNSIKVLKENLQRKTTQRTKKTQNTHMHRHTKIDKYSIQV